MDRVIGNYDFCACGTPIRRGQTLCDRCRRAGKKQGDDLDTPWIMPEPKRTVVGEVTPVGALAAARERIRALEADRASTLMTAIGALTDGDRDIRQETATAILREVEECLQKMIPATPSLDVEFAFRAICRKHGATP